MRNQLIAMLSIFLLFNTTFIMARELRVMRGENSYWKCDAFDSTNKQWIAKSSYQRVAINKAFDACKKESTVPESCKTAKEYCEAIIKGVSTRPMWRCTALDQMAKAWVSDVYSHRNDAAIGARAYCEQRSAMPTSCYVNLLTCRNINERH